MVRLDQSSSEMKDNHNGANIHINGIVQGVGFRPFVYNLATSLALKGWVRNSASGVDILVSGDRPTLDSFIQKLQEQAPPLSQIDTFEVDWQPTPDFSQFEIIPSQDQAGAFQPISPDVSICPDCLRELFDPSDKRYRYPFINCTNCGPRFTIIKGIPYDRPLTTMAPFEMCDYCREEYEDPANRRFHAQPVACPDCGPHIWLESDDGISPRNTLKKRCSRPARCSKRARSWPSKVWVASTLPAMPAIRRPSVYCGNANCALTSPLPLWSTTGSWPVSIA